jgi:hypothetical protein
MKAGSREHFRGCLCCDLSRRGFLAGVGALGAASLMPALAAQTQAQAKPVLIDTTFISIHPNIRSSGSATKMRASSRIFPARLPGPRAS